MTTIVATSFLRRTFNGDAARIEGAIVGAVRDAHNRSDDARIASGLKTNHAYGSTFWLALPEELIAHLTPVLDDNVEVVPVSGAPYSILVVGGVAILPVKVIENGSRDGHMRVRVSDMRARLTSINFREQASLFDEDQEPEAVGETVPMLLEQRERERKAIEAIASVLVVVAVECDPSGGVRGVEVGVATFDSDGYIYFTDSQRLSVLGTTLPFPVPTPVEGGTFDSGPQRRPDLKLNEEDPAVGGDNQVDAE